jgi:epoxyqueuosine reductase
MEYLKKWIAEGRHGGMKYMEDFDARAKKFWENFPAAKSIIVVGVNYYGDGPKSTGPAQDSHGRPCTFRTVPNGQGRVARYAWGRDYHHVIGKRLEAFREKLNEAAGRPVRAEICVDTRPLLERSLAQKAGLGFIGKQSQLLSPKFGPWLFLAELVTDLELEPDLPYLGSCGSCRICIDECPTKAIQEVGGIDARRCIAYLTIEHKGEISEELKPLVNDWVFGCDICLQVCPYASKGKETGWTELKAASGFGTTLDLTELARIPSNGVYEKKFKGTAIMRANRKQLLRNAQIVSKNLKLTGKGDRSLVKRTQRPVPFSLQDENQRSTLQRMG